MKKIFLYHRVSTEQQAEDGSGMARQADLLQSYIDRTRIVESMDDPVPVVLEDGGLSAFKGHNFLHGQLGRWMEEVRAGMWDGSILVVENIDRFSRQNPFNVMGYLHDLINHSVAIHDVNMNMVISRENSAMLPMVMMQAQRAYDESKFKSNRIRAGWAKKRDNAFNNGTIVTNKRPKWIDIVDNQYVLNAKARIVTEIFRLYQMGIGCPTIAKTLREMGDDWRFDRIWTGEAVHKVLRNRRVTGVIFISELIRDYNSTDNPIDQKRYEMNVYPPVIGEDEFNLVQQLLSSRRSGKATGGKRITKKRNDDGSVVTDVNGYPTYDFIDGGKITKSNIFNAVCRCAKCGSPMYHNIVVSKRTPAKATSPVVQEYRYIRCLNERDGLCDNKSLRYDVIERFIMEHIKGLDFNTIIQENRINPEVELIRLKLEQEREHIREYEHGIKRLRNSGKKVPFDVLVELEDAQERLKALEDKQATFADVHVDLDILKHVDLDALYDVTNIELRGRVENELSKVLEKVELHRDGKNYVITFKYRRVDVLKHVLMITASKTPVLVSGVCIETVGDTVAYSTPSFDIIVVDGGDLCFQPIDDEPLSIIDYSFLMNYVDGTEGADVVAAWMKHNMNFLFTR